MRFLRYFSHYYRFELVPREMQNTFRIKMNLIDLRTIGWEKISIRNYYYGRKSNEMNVVEFRLY